VTFCASLTPVCLVFEKKKKKKSASRGERRGTKLSKKWKKITRGERKRNENLYYLEAQEQRVQVREDAHEQRAQVVADHGFLFSLSSLSLSKQ
jgi:ABC-type tungstate transport system permease subunit